MLKQLDENSVEITHEISAIDLKEPVLPRTAWNNQIAYFKILFKVKKTLDQIESKTILHDKNANNMDL